MQRLKNWLLNYRVYSAIGLVLWSAIVWILGPSLGMTTVGARLIVICFFVALWIAFILIKSYMARRASERIGEMFSIMADSASLNATPDKRPELDHLKKRLLNAVQKIKSSKLGHTSGRAALYELPWYMILGNPAAGKSSAIFNSGLNFPFADSDGKVIHGVGGTRNCDWFFTTEGIVLDTAGRYSVYLEDRQEWLGFLGMLKKYRPKVPINGIIVAVSVPELTQSSPDFGVSLAKQLRQRIQELTERLSVFLPVYVIFTKTDLVSGFVEFFEDLDPKEREHVWGATLPYEQAANFDALETYEKRFDELYDGLRDMATDRMARNRGQNHSPGLLTFPLEFLSIKPALSRFIATLFEDNPYQFRPTLRGFYFTSALQEGVALSTSANRIIDRFGLSGAPLKREPIDSQGGFFLRDLFSRVVFADRNLVRQYASPRRARLRLAGFFAGLGALGIGLGMLAWSYVGNQQLIHSVQADMDAAVKIQATSNDLGTRLQALTILQDRLEQLYTYRNDHPLSLAMGLYQGEQIETRLRKEYFAGAKTLMLEPVRDNLEAYLGKVADGTIHLAPSAPKQSTESEQPRVQLAAALASTPDTVADDAYNALKTYLMLGDRSHIETGHLSDQITRYWRSWLEENRGSANRETVVRNAEKIIGYYLSQANEPDLPLIENRLALVEQSREVLRKAVRGLPARDRVYNEIKGRANTRFPAMTVVRIQGDRDKSIIAGSYAIPGAFTRTAWEEFIQPAFKEAAEKQLDSSDWVLRTNYKDDLTLEGSPELLQKEFARMYKEEYIREWKKFVQGITIQEFPSVEEAAKRLDRLSNPQNSPINKLLLTIHRETSWDNPSALGAGVEAAKGSVWNWFKERVLRLSTNTQTRARDQVYKAATADAGPTGVVGGEFAPIAVLVVQRGDSREGVSLMSGYLNVLTKVRGRFEAILNEGDVGPGSLALMKATFTASNSELSEALKYVDESMLAGMSESAKETIRPLLVRPLMQAFAAILKPAQEELNRVWEAEVHEPFTRNVAMKYPFSDSRVEASPAEIAQYFGPSGSASKFLQNSLGPLIIRRGDTIVPRTWANMGIALNADFANNVPRYVTPLGITGGSSNGTESSGVDGEISFQLQPVPTPGLSEIVVEIDGQVLRYRNGPQDWSTFKWPSPSNAPGTRIYGVTFDGQIVEVANFPGRFGLNKLISSAEKNKLSDGLFNLAWNKGNNKIALNFRMISGPSGGGSAPAPTSATNLRHLALPPRVAG